MLMRNDVGSTVSRRVAVLDTAGVSESVTVIVTVPVPALVGVPVMVPVGAIVNPVGKPVTDHV